MASRGLLGLLYWYALYPVHQLVFSGMVEAIGRRAESGPAPAGDAPPPAVEAP